MSSILSKPTVLGDRTNGQPSTEHLAPVQPQMATVKSGVGRGLTHLLHLPSVYASIVTFRVRFSCCGINVGALKYEYGRIVHLFP